MKIRPALAAAGAAALLAGAWTGTAAAAPSTTGQAARSEHVCAKPTPGFASCHAIVRTDITGNGNRNNGKPGGGGGTPVPPTSGYTPSDIQSAYKLAGLVTNATVAIVDAYDDPNAEKDLGYYRTALGLSPCTTANGCFQKVDQHGGTTYPRANGGWAQEISLDVDMVSAACPSCKILLVEANSASFADLGAAVDFAASVPGIIAISNSYGGSDTAGNSDYDHPGVAITASTGDNGYGVESPASFDTVVAVGGTSLKKASTSRGWTESAWSGAGSGCSTLNAKPSWQTNATQCSGKANADVSAVADPNTGVAVYDSYAYQGRSGWLVFGGTSASSPIVASVYALAGPVSGSAASYTWAHAGGLNDVTSGSNGSCSTAVWCNAGAGWDGPTGLGTPNGTSAF